MGFMKEWSMRWSHRGVARVKKTGTLKAVNAIKAGAKATWKHARDSMKNAKRGVASRPGTAPHTHTKRKGRPGKKLKDTIGWNFTENKEGALVGAVAQWARKIAGLHEHGGSQQLTRYENTKARKKKYLTRREMSRAEMNDRKREHKKKIAGRDYRGLILRRPGEEIGWAQSGIDNKNRNSIRKRDQGLRRINDVGTKNELKAIRKYYDERSSSKGPEKYIKRKFKARYPRRAFMQPALHSVGLAKLRSTLSR